VRQWRVEKRSDVTAELVPDWRQPLPGGQRGEVESTGVWRGASAVLDTAGSDRCSVWSTDFTEDANDDAT
jgi:hypothetical protein